MKSKPLRVYLQSWSFGECGVPHHSKVHSCTAVVNELITYFIKNITLSLLLETSEIGCKSERERERERGRERETEMKDLYTD